MSDVVLNPLSHGTPHGGAAPLGIAAALSDPPQALRNLAEGHILQGTVAGTDSHGQLLVRTRFGLLALQTAHKLPIGSQLILEVRSTGPRVHVLILQVRSTSAAPVQPGAPAAAAQPHSITPLPDVISVGQSLRAVVQSPLPSTAGPLPGPAALPAGSELVLRITAVGVATAPTVTGPGTQGLPTGGPQAPSSPGGVTAAGPPAGALAPAPQPGTLPPGPSSAELAATLERSGRQAATLAQVGRAAAEPGPPAGAGRVPPTAGGGDSPALPPGAAAGVRPVSTAGAELPLPRFTGQVIALSKGGNPIVQTPLGTLSLDLRVPIPVGSSLAFELLPIEPAKLGQVSAGRPPPWPALAAALDSLAVDPALKAQLLPRLFPQTGPRLAAGLLLFLSALKGGSIEGWLGGLAGQLDASRRAPKLDALRSGLTSLSRTVEGSGGEWRLFLIPLLHDGNLEPLRLYQRDHHEDADDGPDRKASATRFIIDVELSRLGGLQLDGLVKSQSFDLVVRSDRPLSPAAHRQIAAIFDGANAMAGIDGRISFQSTSGRQVFDDDADPLHRHPNVTI